jgi:hypothetical protein
MQTSYQKIAVETVIYLPILKQKLMDLLDNPNELESLFVHASFEAYQAYLELDERNEAEWELTQKQLRENLEAKLNANLIYYRPLLTVVKKSRFVEVDKKLLRDIFDNFRELIYLLNHENRTQKPMNQ